MSHFYAKLGAGMAQTEPTRRGSKSTGHGAVVASWNGAIKTSVWYDTEHDRDMFRVEMVPWHGSGESMVLADGELGKIETVTWPVAERV